MCYGAIKPILLKQVGGITRIPEAGEEAVV